MTSILEKEGRWHQPLPNQAAMPFQEDDFREIDHEVDRYTINLYQSLINMCSYKHSIHAVMYDIVWQYQHSSNSGWVGEHFSAAWRRPWIGGSVAVEGNYDDLTATLENDGQGNPTKSGSLLSSELV